MFRFIPPLDVQTPHNSNVAVYAQVCWLFCMPNPVGRLIKTSLCFSTNWIIAFFWRTFNSRIQNFWDTRSKTEATFAMFTCTREMNLRSKSHFTKNVKRPVIGQFAWTEVATGWSRRSYVGEEWLRDEPVGGYRDSGYRVCSFSCGIRLVQNKVVHTAVQYGVLRAQWHYGKSCCTKSCCLACK